MQGPINKVDGQIAEGVARPLDTSATPVESPGTKFTDEQRRKLGIGRAGRLSRARYKARSARALKSALAQVTAANLKE